MIKIYEVGGKIRDESIVFSGNTLKSVFEWLYKMKIISKDEMKYQIDLLEKNDYIYS